MLQLLPACADWLAGGRPFAVATIIAARGSTPRPVGTAMAVDGAGEVRGSLSGGCIEAEVYECCREVLDTGVPLRRRFGYSDAEAFAVGLTCGGELEVHVQRLQGPDPQLLALARTGTGALVWDLAAPRPRPVAAAGEDPHVSALAEAGQSGLVRGCARSELFVAASLPAPRLLVFGANDFAAALLRQAALLGYGTTLCDARPVFATPARFPEAGRVVVDWPDRYLRAEQDAGRLDGRTAVCVLTHDARFDLPLLELALGLPLAYVGAMGSRRTHEERAAALRRRGVPGAALARLHSPIGLDLGGATPAEVALSVLAEIVAARNGRTAVLPLGRVSGPLHGPAPAPPPDRAGPRPS
ncbi:XdhC family protein, partial [Arthrobacter deserti]|nr:XdhC family protein [Arthrobacter deserti]